MPPLPSHIPPVSGTYVVLLLLKKRRSIEVGKLGRIVFFPGWYAYVGSAMGPGGVAARVRRHYLRRKKAHWHLDYFRPATRMEGLFVNSGRDPKEHAWAQRLGQPPLDGLAICGFGSTDCRCMAHLFYYEQSPDRACMSLILNAQWFPLKVSAKNR